MKKSLYVLILVLALVTMNLSPASAKLKGLAINSPDVKIILKNVQTARMHDFRYKNNGEYIQASFSFLWETIRLEKFVDNDFYSLYISDDFFYIYNQDGKFWGVGMWMKEIEKKDIAITPDDEGMLESILSIALTRIKAAVPHTLTPPAATQ